MSSHFRWSVLMASLTIAGFQLMHQQNVPPGLLGQPPTLRKLRDPQRGPTLEMEHGPQDGPEFIPDQILVTTREYDLFLSGIP